MAFTFGFYNSLDHDRTYTAEQMGAIFDGVIEDGVFSAIGEAMKVSAATGMSVDVGTGRAWFNHTWSLNDSKYRLTLDASDVTMQRIDAVVLEVDTTTAQRKNSLKIVKGTPVLNSPQRPVLYNSNGIFQHALAYITVPANASAIVAGNITNVVGQGVAASGGAPFVTAPLNHVDISTLFTQWGGQFDAWFTDIKNQLSGSVVTNLQNQITANKTAITALQNADTTLQSQITANKTSIGNIGIKEIYHADNLSFTFSSSTPAKYVTISLPAFYTNTLMFLYVVDAANSESKGGNSITLYAGTITVYGQTPIGYVATGTIFDEDATQSYDSCILYNLKTKNIVFYNRRTKIGSAGYGLYKTGGSYGDTNKTQLTYALGHDTQISYTSSGTYTISFAIYSILP